MISPEAKVQLVISNPEYINLNRYSNSLSKLLARYPDGVPDKLICQSLMISQDELDVLWAGVLERLRAHLLPTEPHEEFPD